MNIPEGWNLEGNKLVRTCEFGTFEEAIIFINRVATIATQLNHHPEIINMYNRVTLRLSTHDAGDSVTEKDAEFAEKVNGI